MGYELIMGLVQAATLTLAMASWWSCACRVYAMHYSTHRLEAIVWHQVAAGLALGLAGMAVWIPGDVLSLFAAGGLWWAMFSSMGEWANGSPPWTWRRAATVSAANAA